jgi:hypothetical protein
MISWETKGSTNNLERFLKEMQANDIFAGLERFAQQGADALAAATPTDTGETARSWGYEISQEDGKYVITWTNSHMAAGTPVIIMLQYGHGTGTGGYVEGIDIINPALKPVFDQIADQAWKVVTSK